MASQYYKKTLFPHHTREKAEREEREKLLGGDRGKSGRPLTSAWRRIGPLGRSADPENRKQLDPGAPGENRPKEKRVKIVDGHS